MKEEGRGQQLTATAGEEWGINESAVFQWREGSDVLRDISPNCLHRSQWKLWKAVDLKRSGIGPGYISSK